MFENVVDMTTTFSIKIFLHYSTKSNGNRRQSTVFLASRIRPHFSRAISPQVNKIRQHLTKFFVKGCRILSKFIWKCCRILRQSFLTNFAPRSLTNFDRIRQANAVQICRIMRSKARHNSIDPRLVSFCRKKLNALLLKN